MDDFKGKYCNSGPYPLMNAIASTVKNGTFGTCNNKSTTTVKTTTATTIITTSTSYTDQITCNNETELLSDEADCTAFYLCLSGIDKPVSKLKCPDNMWFDLVANTCLFTMPVSFNYFLKLNFLKNIFKLKYRCQPLPTTSTVTTKNLLKLQI